MSVSSTFLTTEEIKTLRQAVEKEFPYDFALQEIHLARQIILKEAEKMGIDFLSYIKKYCEKPIP